MNPYDLAKLILQNIKVLDPNDAVFELNQLHDLVNRDFSKEIKILSIPNVSGRPQMLKRAAKLFQKDYPDYQKSQLVSDHIDRYKLRKEQ